MGMYDTIKINVARLPLSKSDTERLQNAPVDFQTKSLERALFTYTITDDGYLDQSGSWWDDDAHRQTSPVRLVDAHGVVFFYASVEGEWFEFEARFTEGKLSRMARVDARHVSRDQTCVWTYELPVAELQAAGY